MPIARNKRTKPREARGKKDFFGKVYENRVEVAAGVLAVCIVAVLLSLSGTAPGAAQNLQPTGSAERPQKVIDCMAENPDLPADACWDSYYQEKAITENLASFCEKIKSEETRNHCERYF
jgi:hypothetical protein